jgi:hypothetical protein
MTDKDKASGAAVAQGAMPSTTDGMDAFSELSDMFAEEDERLRKSESNVLSQNLSGFASCFPDWDLHPPVD